MANKIYRTVTLSACNGQHVNPQTNEFEDYCEVLIGDYTPGRASRALRKATGVETITILNVETETRKYVMDYETFLAYATAITE